MRRAVRIVLVVAILLFGVALLRIEAHWQGPTLIAFSGDHGIHLGDVFVLGAAALGAWLLWARTARGS